jgi:three-Cys-motif partner protein
MTSYNRDGKVGPWAREKLSYPEKYLRAYTTILRKQKFRGYFYIDGFAGGGQAPLRSASTSETEPHDTIFPELNLENEPEFAQYIDGSPRVALRVEPPFTRYVFIEQNPSRARELEGLKTDFPNRTIKIYPETAQHVIGTRIVGSGLDWKKYRGIIFLDPFGMQVEWDIIERIASTQALEVFINFPVGMAIQRKLPRDPRKLSDRDRTKLDQYFGSEGWFDIVYKNNKNLFADESLSKRQDAGEALAEWYQERLRSAFGYGAQPRLVKNHRGSHLYYLLFASPNANGAKIAKDVLKQGTPPDTLL